MAKDNNNNKGLFWTPLGGNNIDQFSGNCHYYNAVTEDKDGLVQKNGVIVDLGLFDNHDGIAEVKSETAFADVRAILKEKKADAVLLTHAHIDHIGAVAEYVRLGYEMPPIYAGKFTIAMLKRSFADKNIPYNKWPQIKEIDKGAKLKIGGMDIEAVSVSHSVPDAFAFYIKTNEGKMFHTGDFKIDQTVNLGKGTDLKRIAEIGKEGVDAMVADATTVFVEGYAREEAKIEDAYTKLVKEAAGRQVIVAASGGHMERYTSIFKAAANNDRTVINAGTPYQVSHLRGLKTAGYDITLGGKIKFVSVKNKEAAKIKPENAMIVTSGSLRESSYLEDALAGREAPFKVEKNALVIVESRHIPEAMIANAKKLGVQIITSGDFQDIAGSGHAQKSDMVDLANLAKPKMIAPTHCHQDRGKEFAETLTKEGFNIAPIPLNGMTFKITSNGFELDSYKKANWVIANTIPDSKWKAQEFVVEQKPSKGRGGVPHRKSEENVNRFDNAKRIIAEYKTKKKQRVKVKQITDFVKKQLGR